MGATTRKDYGASAKVADTNPVMKRISHMNAPYSVQATGAEIQGKIKQVTNLAEFNALNARDRVLLGNKEGFIKAIDKTVDAEQLTFTYKDQQREDVDQVLTKEEVFANAFMTYIDDKY